MKQNIQFSHFIFSVCVSICCSVTYTSAISAQNSPVSSQEPDTLLARIAGLDQQYFEAYNNCNLDLLKEFHATEMEAYHDIGGGPVSGDVVVEGLKRGLCGGSDQWRRELVPGTLEAYIIAGYGAIHMADHLFYKTEEEGEEELAIAAKMINLWHNDGGDWKITLLISYDHGPPPSNPAPQSSSAQPVMIFENGAVEQDLDNKIRAHMEKLEIPGLSAAVSRDGEILWENSYGYASLELEAAVTHATVFPYASIAKIFTGTAILRLVQEERFSFEDPITELLPDLPQTWSGVTVRHLLSNTSGLPDLNEGRRFENPFPAPKESWEEILITLSNHEVDFTPGESFAYNQTNYALLGMLLEKFDGRKIEKLVEEEFAAPLDLGSLKYGDARDAIPSRADWYTRFDFSSGIPQPGSVRPLWIEYPSFNYTGAGLNGTARDLARFTDAVASERFVNEKYKTEMWTAVKLSDGTIFRFDNSTAGSGLGWWVNDDPDHPYVSMGGGSSGTLRHYINEGLTLVVLTNLMGAEPDKIADILANTFLKMEITN